MTIWTSYPGETNVSGHGAGQVTVCRRWMGTGQQINCGALTSLYPGAVEPNMVSQLHPAPSLYINQYEPETNESGSGQSVWRVTVGGDGWRPHTNCYLTGVFLLLANPMFHGNTLLIVIWTSNMQNRISKIYPEQTFIDSESGTMVSDCEEASSYILSWICKSQHCFRVFT